MSKKNKKTNTKSRFENVEYIITPEMQMLIDGFKKCGYNVTVTPSVNLCSSFKNFSYIKYRRYCTEICIPDREDSDGEPYTFYFSPSGQKIINFDYDSRFCELIEE